MALTLTTITVRQRLMTIDVTYHDVAASSVALTCVGSGDPSIATVTLANGTVLHATQTYCSDHANDQFTISPGAVHVSYAVFPTPSDFAQPFSFYWSAGSWSGTVSGIRI